MSDPDVWGGIIGCVLCASVLVPLFLKKRRELRALGTELEAEAPEESAGNPYRSAASLEVERARPRVYCVDCAHHYISTKQVHCCRAVLDPVDGGSSYCAKVNPNFDCIHFRSKT